MSNSINSYKQSYNIDDHSNTPAAYDGIGYTIRNFPSHPKEGFLIFIDMLGAKGIWQRKDINDVFNRWKEILSQFINSLNNSKLSRFNPYCAIFSDTLIITCPCSIDHINSIFELLLQPFIYSMETRFFLRGAISYGTYYLSKILIIGPAVDEAATCHDQLEWIGISTTPILSKYLFNKGYNKETDSYIHNCLVPTKNNPQKGFALKWFKCENQTLIQILRDEYNKQSKLSIKKKYENTLKFYKFYNCNYRA
jgi:hypothetical protein